MMRALFAMLLAFLAPAGLGPLAAQDTMPPAPYAYNQLDDPQLEAEAAALMLTLRCLKCQSQRASRIPMRRMAGDMRHQVRSRILAGESPDQIRSWLVARYWRLCQLFALPSARPPGRFFAIPVLVLLIVGAILLRRSGQAPRGRWDRRMIGGWLAIGAVGAGGLCDSRPCCCVCRCEGLALFGAVLGARSGRLCLAGFARTARRAQAAGIAYFRSRRSDGGRPRRVVRPHPAAARLPADFRCICPPRAVRRCGGGCCDRG